MRTIHALTIAAGLLAAPSPTRAQAVAPEPRRLAVEVLDGASLRSDGKGPYLDATGDVSAIANNGLALCTSFRSCGALPARPPVPESDRALVVDLTRPVAGSG